MKSDKSVRGKCHFCHENGHMARDCPVKQKSKAYSKGGTVRFSKGSVNCAEKVENSDPDEIINEEALVTSDQVNDFEWIIDSGATQHMTFDIDSLSDYIEFKVRCTVNLGDNGTILAYGKGTYHIVADLEDKVQHIALHDVLYLPDLKKNLLSVQAMTRQGASVELERNKCRIMRNSKLLGIDEMQGKLHVLKVVPVEHMNIAKENTDMELWHNCFGHLGYDNVSKLIKGKMVEGMNCDVQVKPKFVCKPCIMGKQHRIPYPKGVSTRATEAFEVVHSDVCGPMPTSSYGGSQYFVTFIDDYTRYTHVYFIKHKHEVLDKLKEFFNFTTNFTGKQIRTLVIENQVKTLRSDNGGEYGSKLFETYLKEKGIFHQTTVPHNPAQNGVSERMNRTLVETARSMMSHAKMPVEFWAEAISTAVYLRNRSPTISLPGITPFECLFNRKPDVSNLKVFGCLSFAHIPKSQRKKFDEKSKKTVFVGYPQGTKGYKLFDLSTKGFIRSRDVIFAEERFHNFSDEQSSTVDLEFVYPVQDNPQATVPDVKVTDQPEVDNQPLPVNQPVHDGQPYQVGPNYEENFMREVENLPPKRQCNPPVRFIEEEFYAADALTADINEPNNISEAWKGEHSVYWKEATDCEYDSWDLVPLPKGKNVVGSR